MVKNNIAVVGGAGFVGKTLAKHFAKNFNVTIVDVQPCPEELGSSVSYVQCDIRDYQQVAKGLKGAEIVIHTAIVQIPLINEKKQLGYEVNVIGTQNVCKAVEADSRIKGMVLAGTWHTIGERDLKGIVDEEFGFRPDKVEERARLYALSKMAQESIVRYYDEMSNKIYGILRMGTVLGDGMPSATAANIFVEKGLRGESLTPFKQSMYRPMLYVDVNDVCNAYEIFAQKILNGQCSKGGSSLAHIVNVYYPRPITIFELAEIIRKIIVECTNGRVNPEVKVVDKGLPVMFDEDDKNKIKVDIEKARSFLGLARLHSPEETLTEMIKQKTKY
jgi:UDP-glucose 4-epimerase